MISEINVFENRIYDAIISSKYQYQLLSFMNKEMIKS